MWRPTEWSEIEALIGYAEETAGLDFKRELPSNGELAKDVAAMTVNGGIVVIGVDEDRDTGLGVVDRAGTAAWRRGEGPAGRRDTGPSVTRRRRCGRG